MNLGDLGNLFYLGKLCKMNHDYQGTNQSLRYKSSYNCKECNLVLDRKRNGSKARIFPNKNDPRPSGIPIPENHYLGLLCKYGHDYMETGYSLRSARRTCITCVSITSRNERSKERGKKWRKNNPAYMKQYFQAYYQQNKAKIIESSRKFEKTPKGKANKKICVQRRRAIIAAAPRIPYTSSELLAHFDVHGNECVYCGSKENLTPDHVIPFAKGGQDALINILPCCRTCNSSKQDSDYVQWYRKSPHFNLERLAKISEFLGDKRAHHFQIKEAP